MSEKVSGRKKARKRRGIERNQRRRQQEKLQQQIDEAVAGVVRQAVERALQDDVTLVLGREKSQRRDTSDLTVVEARCNECDTRYRSYFVRGGFYDRYLLAFDGLVEIAVPRVRCICGGVVDFEFVHLAPYGRLWIDLEQRARQLAGICVSLRDSVQILAWSNKQPLSISTVNRLVNETAVLAEGFRTGEFRRVPAVVMLDGIWVKMLEPTGELFTDKLGRRRKRVKLREFPLLVAYGVDPSSGDRWVLDWEEGRGEDEESWRRLLERLLGRGVHAERGLELFVHDGSGGLEKAFEFVFFGHGVEHQRCIFHKLRNVMRDLTAEPEMSRKERQERRREVVTDAAAVYHGEDESHVRLRLIAFQAKWEAKEPNAVATLERDFDQTLAYLRVLERAQLRGLEYRVECLRATSALERVQRHFRQKVRQVVIFHARQGIAAAMQLVISRRGLDGATTEQWSAMIEEALLAA